MAQAAFKTGAGLRSGSAVDAELQALAVHVVGEALHVREFLVGMQHAAAVALALPGVVDVDIHIARVAHTRRDDQVGGCLHVLLRHLAGKPVP